MGLIILAAMIAIAVMAGAWYGRLQERAAWTRRLLNKGINPNTLGMHISVSPLEPLDSETDAMRDSVREIAREVERLAEGQRFLTRVLTEKKSDEPDTPKE